MNDVQQKQRMDEILLREQDYRQRGIENMAQAHDDIDFLFTRVNLLVRELEACNKARQEKADDQD